jgi:hypothetical protein
MRPSSYRGWRIWVEHDGDVAIAWAEDDRGTRKGAVCATADEAVNRVRKLVDQQKDETGG